MPSIAEKVASYGARKAGLNLDFSQDGISVDLTDEQVERAKSFVRAVISPTVNPKTGGRKLKIGQTWRIVVEPVLEVYGFYIFGGIGALVAGGILLSRLGRKKKRNV